MRLRFPEREIERHAARYSYGRNETELLALRQSVLRAGYLTKRQLRLLARWKSPRSAPQIEKNSETFIKEVTHFALHASAERTRIEALTLLSGVLWPTASVVLHVFHTDPYPIIDFRALWSVNAKVPSQYTFSFWLKYVKYCRSVAKRSEVNMRVLDRALWQYSRDNQPKNVA